MAKAVDEARAAQVRDPAKIPHIAGFDQDIRAVRWLCGMPIGGAEGFGSLRKAPLWPRLEDPPALGGRGGIIVVNPPYGERLGEVEG